MVQILLLNLPFTLQRATASEDLILYHCSDDVKNDLATGICLFLALHPEVYLQDDFHANLKKEKQFSEEKEMFEEGSG